MGLGPYTAPRAHEFTRLAVASDVKNPEQNVPVGDRRARGVRGMSVSRRAFEAFYWTAGVLKPRWGGISAIKNPGFSGFYPSDPNGHIPVRSSLQ